ncbi:NADPH-dependent FMN reductase [Steroidobacter denitrificans]|uniref:NADPH-dependent FMN reductase n=1 Tax=Steroidobacter denitrificans TaxID=465721 RepID=A0A127FC10_STEDE|nr:NADPH-dependent FMN reductase [Steroidobacter denitrificans]AMN47145.1 NADPH-dependent FMN reductase [Steroidobacter denitrificans]
MKPRLHVITASTRPGRVGPAVAHWFLDFARSHGHFDVHAVDLAELDLPIYNESHHPATQEYEHAHTREWSGSVAAADAFVFVTPEYNFNPPPSLVNALNYVYREWNYKACGFVSYGGVSGGLRAVQMAKQLVTTLKMMPMVESVAVPMVAQSLDEQGNFVSNRLIDHSAQQMLDELAKWTCALMPLHRPVSN